MPYPISFSGTFACSDSSNNTTTDTTTVYYTDQNEIKPIEQLINFQTPNNFPTQTLNCNLSFEVNIDNTKYDESFTYTILGLDSIVITKKGGKSGNGTYTIDFKLQGDRLDEYIVYDVSCNYPTENGYASGLFEMESDLVPPNLFWSIRDKVSDDSKFWVTLVNVTTSYNFNWSFLSSDGSDYLLTLGPMILGASDILNSYKFTSSTIRSFIGLAWTTQLLTFIDYKESGALDCSYNSTNNIVTIFLGKDVLKPPTFQAPPADASKYDFSFNFYDTAGGIEIKETIDLSYNIPNQTNQYIIITKGGDSKYGNGTYKLQFSENKNDPNVFDVSSNYQDISGNFSITRSSTYSNNYDTWTIINIDTLNTFVTSLVPGSNKNVYKFGWGLVENTDDYEKLLLIAPMIIGASDILNTYGKGPNSTIFIGPSWITQLLNPNPIANSLKLTNINK